MFQSKILGKGAKLKESKISSIFSMFFHKMIKKVLKFRKYIVTNNSNGFIMFQSKILAKSAKLNESKISSIFSMLFL